jgi:hypothetical protein
MFKQFKILFILTLFHIAPSYADQTTEAKALIHALQYEKIITSQITEVNNYQLQKRIDALAARSASITKEKQEQRVETLNEAAKIIVKLLNWKEIEQPIVQVFEKELSKEEMTKLSAFFQTAAGQYYVNEFQSASAPLAITFDKFVDQLVDQFIDEPNKPLNVVSALDANETQASRLLIKLGTKDATAAIEKSREQLISMMTEATKPKSNKKSDLEQHKKAILGLKKAYSYEQINWRYAQVLSKQMKPEQITALLNAIDNPEIITLIQKFSTTSIKINALITTKIMSNEEFNKLLMKL